MAHEVDEVAQTADAHCARRHQVEQVREQRRLLIEVVALARFAAARPLIELGDEPIGVVAPLVGAPHALGNRILPGAAQSHPHLVEASRRERLPVQIDPRSAEQP